MKTLKEHLGGRRINPDHIVSHERMPAGYCHYSDGRTPPPLYRCTLSTREVVTVIGGKHTLLGK